MKPTLTLIHIGRDSWERPVYESDARLYVDLSPRERCYPQICTKSGNVFDGEPDNPIREYIEIIFIPQRDTW